MAEKLELKQKISLGEERGQKVRISAKNLTCFLTFGKQVAEKLEQQLKSLLASQNWEASDQKSSIKFLFLQNY